MKEREVMKVTSDLIKKGDMTTYSVINDLIGEVNYIDRNRYILNISNEFVSVGVFDAETGIENIISVSDRGNHCNTNIETKKFNRIIQMLEKYHTLIDGLSISGYLILKSSAVFGRK